LKCISQSEQTAAVGRIYVAGASVQEQAKLAEGFEEELLRCASFSLQARFEHELAMGTAGHRGRPDFQRHVGAACKAEAVLRGQAPVSAEGIAAVMHAPRAAEPGRPGEKHERVHGHSMLADEELDVGRDGLAQVRQVGQDLNCGPVDRGNLEASGLREFRGTLTFF